MKLIGKVGKQTLFAYWDGNLVKFAVDGYDIGVFDPKVMDEPILFLNNTKANELSGQAKEKITAFAENINEQDLKVLAERYNLKARNRIAKELGLEEGQLIGITEIDLDQKVKTKETMQEEENVEEEKVEDQKEEEKEKEEAETDELTTKDIDIKETVNMNVMATDMKTIGQVLERAGVLPQDSDKKFTKIGIVESSDLNEKTGKGITTRLTPVAIADDGTVVPLNMEQDSREGNAPREINYQKRTDGTVEQDDILSRWKIGNSGETLSMEKSNDSGEIEVSYSPGKTKGVNGVEGNKSVDQQLETSKVYWKTNKDVRESEYKGIYHVDEEQEEAEIEGKTDMKDMKQGQKGEVETATHEDVDGNNDTKSHDHEEEEDEEDEIVPWKTHRRGY